MQRNLFLTRFFRWIPQRIVLAAFGFLAVVNAYTMRSALSMTIIRMVGDERRDKADREFGEQQFDWSSDVQGMILGAFYLGYLLMHLPGGLLAEKFGGKLALGLGLLWTSVFSLLSPLVTFYFGSVGLIIWRVFVGLGEGSTFPALSVLVSRWIPIKERSRLGALVFGGGQMGTVIGMFCTGFLMEYYPNTWSPAFYVYGICGLLWSLLFFLLCYKDPASHPFITDKELAFLEAELGELSRPKDLPRTPWCEMLRSKELYALVMAQVGHDWGFYVMNSDLPKYLNDVIGMSIRDNGIFSALPYLVMWVTSITAGWVADVMIKRECWSITNVRKLFTFLGAMGPAIFMMAASYMGTNRPLVITMFTLAMGMMGLYYPGLKVNPMDLAPNYSGIVMGFVNGMGSISGILAPMSVGLMAPDSTMNQWRLVFWLAFAILVISGMGFVIWGSALRQAWNTPDPNVPRTARCKCKCLCCISGDTSENPQTEGAPPNEPKKK